LFDNSFEVGAAQDLLSDGADALIDIRRHDGTDIIGRYSLGPHQDEGLGFINFGEDKRKINPAEHGKAKR
jgi:hypothetical protein